jgi:hypothetical protein
MTSSNYGGPWVESNALPFPEMGYSHLLGPPSLTFTAHILVAPLGNDPSQQAYETRARTCGGAIL